MPRSKYMKNHVLLIVALFAVVGCDRLKLDEQTKIQIQLPGSASSLSSKVETSFVGLSPIPSGMTGDLPINCYLIAASGPEPELRRNICQRKDGTNVFAPRHVGPWVGAAPAGTAIAIDVPSGKDRVIFVVGFHATSVTACRDFKANGFPGHAEISDPYLVGEAGNLELKPGETKDLPLNVSFNPENRFDGCDGPDFPDHSGPGMPAPTQIHIAKEWFPYGKFVADRCQSFDLVLKDDQGRHASFPVGIDVTPEVLSLGSPLTLYSSHQDCASSVNPLSAKLTIPPFSDRIQVAFKTPISTGNIDLNVKNIMAPNPLLVMGAGSFSTFLYSDNSIDLDGPWSILPDVCYPFDLKLRQMGGNDGSNPSGTTVSFSGASGISIFSTLSDCQANSASITSVLLPSAIINKPIFVKMNGVSGDVALTMSSLSFISSTKLIRKGYGTAIATGVAIDGFNQFTGTTCANQPHRVFLVNQYHTPVLQSTSVSVSLSGTRLNFYPTYSDCSMMTAALTSVTIPAGGYQAAFFARPTSLGQGSIAATTTGISPITYNVTIDGLSWTLVKTNGSGVDPNNSCIPFQAELRNPSGTLVQNRQEYLGVYVSGVTSPSISSVHDNPGCTTSNPIKTPLTGPAIANFYIKVNNASGINLPIQVGFTPPMGTENATPINATVTP